MKAFFKVFLVYAAAGFCFCGQARAQMNLPVLTRNIKDWARTNDLTAPLLATTPKAQERRSLVVAPGTWVQKYFPLNDGDWSEAHATLQGHDLWEKIDVRFDAQSGHFIQKTVVMEMSGRELWNETEVGFENDAVLMYRQSDESYTIVFDPPLVLLRESILPKGGSVTTHSSTYGWVLPMG